MLISVILTTRSQPDGLDGAIASVLAQDLLGLPPMSLELIVVDDAGVPPMAQPDGGVWPVRQTWTDSGRRAAARKAGLDAAGGDLIAYCDDSDTWLPDHLRRLLPPLLAEPETVLVFGSQPNESACERDRSLPDGTWALASDVVHRAKAARAMGGFDPQLDSFETGDLWARMSLAGRLQRVSVTVTAHGQIEAIRTDDEAFVRQDQEARRSRFDRSHRAWPHRRPVPFDPATWSTDRRRLLAQVQVNTTRSFGIVGRRLLIGLESRGLEITLGPLDDVERTGLERFVRAPDRSQLGLHLHFPTNPRAMGCERIVHFSTWESTLISRDRVDAINESTSLLLVPSHQNARDYQLCGVTAPIRVLPHGVDPDRFPFVERPAREQFTFGSFGDLSPRKGADLLVRAFTEEFHAHEPVRLLVKQTFAGRDHEIDWPSDPRIVVFSEFLPAEGLLHYLSDLDCFVFPSRGEGFGLPALEAMSTGLPVIATDWSGPSDYLGPADCLPLHYRLVDAAATRSNLTRYFGQWAEPDLEHLRSCLRWVYEHRAEAAAMGRAASARVLRDWTWDHAIDHLVLLLDATANGTEPPVLTQASSRSSPVTRGRDRYSRCRHWGR